MYLLFKCLLFTVINFNHFSNQSGNQYCPESKVHDVVWHESQPNENWIVSEQLCLDDMKMIVTRNCTDIGWIPSDDEISCNTKQVEFNYDSYCPNGYIEIFNTKICILILKPSLWSTDCVQHGSVIDMRHLIRTKPKIIEFLKQWGVDRFWLPARRVNNSEFIKWKLPPPLWNNPIELDKYEMPIDNNGDCLSMNVELRESLENCDSELPLICLFDKNTESIVMKSFCIGNSVSTRLKNYRDTCFTVETITDLDDIQSLTLIDTMDKYFIVQSMIQEFNIEKSPVLIDIIPNLKGYFNKVDWINWVNDIDFIDWDPRLNPTLVHNTSLDLYTVLWNGKWNLVDGSLIKYQIVDDKFYLGDLPNITISYNSSYDGLDVHIEDHIRLWKTNGVLFTCFYNGNMFEPILKFDKIEHTGNRWKLHLPYYKGNARYWCESVTVNDFSVVKSNVLEVQRNIMNDELIYSVSITIPCNVCQFYSEIDVIQNFIIVVTQEMNETSDFDVIQWQIKEIVEFKKNNFEVTLLFHCIVKNIYSYDKLEAGDIIRYLLTHILDEMKTDVRLVFIRDIDTCFSPNPNFPNTLIGHPSVYKNPCIREDDLPPIQHCAGNLIVGAYWDNTYNESNLDCIGDNNNTDIVLMDMLNNELERLNSMNITTKLSELSEMVNINLFDTPASVHYTTEMLQKIMYSPKNVIFNSMPNSTFLENPINTVSEIIDNLLNKNHLVLQKAQSELNTTNIMLGTLDEMASKYSTSESFDKDVVKYSNDGTIVIVKRSLIVMISNPLIKNVTGIAIYKKLSYYAEENFDNYSIRKLFGNETYENIYNDTLEIGVNIPFKTLAQLNIARNGELVPVDRIIFKLFYKDSFFQETQINGTTEILKANSKIIGISIPEYHDEHLPPGIFMILKREVHEVNKTRYGCSDWTMDSTQSGWNKNYANFEMINKYSVLCYVTRLRNYGFVQLLGNDVVVVKAAENKYNNRIIFILTIVGCLLSLFGILMIYMTAFLIKAWRQREATPLILNVCTATGLQLICYLLSETRVFHRHFQCLMIGGSLHYVTIVGFFLSLFVANLQYRRYVIIFGPSTPSYFKTRLFIFGWIVPLLIVLICIYIDRDAYTPTAEFLDLGGICYPSGNILLYAVHLPVIMIFCVNLCVYVWIIVNLNTEQKKLRKSSTRSNTLKQIFLFAYTFFLLSLTWIFGILAHFLTLSVFAYLFVITGTLQGFFIFLFCIIFDSSIRKIYNRIQF